MTARRRLVPVSEVKEMLDFLREQGFSFSAVDVRTDGVTFLPSTQMTVSAYDAYKAKEGKGRDRPPHRP